MKRTLLFVLIIVSALGTFAHARTKIAILSFKGINVEDYVPSAVVEILSTSFIDSGEFEVIERSQLNSVMSELSLQYSDDFSEEDAQDIGNMLGAEIVIIGSVTKLGDRITVNIRGIAVATGTAKFAKKINADSMSELPDNIDNLVAMLTGGEVRETKRTKKKTIVKRTTTTGQKRELNGVNKAGIGMLAGGGAVLVGGIVMTVVDIAVLIPNVRKEKPVSYDAWQKAYTTHLAVFGAGVACAGLGAVMMIAGIPMLVYKGKKMAFNIQGGSDLRFVWTYSF